MPANLTSWIENDNHPGDYYELLGMERFHPRREEVLAEIRHGIRQLVACQNHENREIADRAMLLQQDLGRAEEVFSDESRLAAYREDLIGQIRRDFLTADAARAWSRSQLDAWLRDEQRVHPLAIHDIAVALLTSATYDSQDGSTVGESGTDSKPAPRKTSHTSQPSVFARRPETIERSSVVKPQIDLVDDASSRRRAKETSENVGQRDSPHSSSQLHSDKVVANVFNSVPTEQRAGWKLTPGIVIVGGLILIVFVVDIFWLLGAFSGSEARQGMPPTVSEAELEKKPDVTPLSPAPLASDSDTSVDSVGPDSSRVEPRLPVGTSVTWTGVLESIDGRRNQTDVWRLTVRLDRPEHRLNSAIVLVKDEAFGREMLDYRTKRDRLEQHDNGGSQPSGDRVRFKGQIVLRSGTESAAAHTVRLEWIERVDDPASRAKIVGPPRKESSFRGPLSDHALYGMIRLAPPPGTDVTFRGKFVRYDDDLKTIHVAPGNSQRGAEVFFPSLKFSEYKKGQLVDVTGRVNGQKFRADNDGQTVIRPVVLGKTIQRRGIDQTPIAEPSLAKPNTTQTARNDLNPKYRGPALLVSSNKGVAAVLVDNAWHVLDMSKKVPSKINWSHVDRSGQCWLCGEGGVSRLDGENIQTFGQADGLTSEPLSHVFEDSKHRLWITSWKGGVALLENGQWKAYETTDGLNHMDLNGSTEDARGRIWVAGGAVSVFDNGSFKNDRLGRLFRVQVMSIDGDRRGNVFLGCIGGLFKIFDPIGTRRLSADDGLPQQTVQALYVDSLERVWAGTSGGGIVQIDNENLTVKTEQMLPGNIHVRRITEDSRGVLWAATLEGLWKLKDDSWELENTPTPIDQVHVVASIPDAVAKQLIGWAKGRRTEATASRVAARAKSRPRKKRLDASVNSPVTGRVFRIRQNASKSVIQQNLGAPLAEQAVSVGSQKESYSLFRCPYGPRQVSLLLVGYDDEETVKYLDLEIRVPATDAAVQAIVAKRMIESYLSQLEKSK